MTRLSISFLVCAIGMGIPTCVAQSTHKVQRCVGIELYVRRSELLSQQTELAITQWSAGRQGIHLRIFDLDREPTAARRLAQIESYFHLEKSSLPLLYGSNQYLAGFRDAASFLDKINSLLKLDVYVRDGCRDCAAAKTYLPSLQTRYPGLTVRFFEISANPAANTQMQQLIQHYQQSAVSVPIFHLCNQLVVGFDGDVTGRRLEAILEPWSYTCPPSKVKQAAPPGKELGPTRKTSSRNMHDPHVKQAVFAYAAEPGLLPDQESELADVSPSPVPDAKNAEVGSQTELPLPGDLPLGESAQELDAVEVRWFGRLSASRQGLPLFTIAIGLVDGFNPCAMWVLLFLLSVLVNLRSPQKILAVAGTFVLISGIVYFAFMAAWLNVLVFVGHLRGVQVVLALLAMTVGVIHIKDFFAFK